MTIFGTDVFGWAEGKNNPQVVMTNTFMAGWQGVFVVKDRPKL